MKIDKKILIIFMIISAFFYSCDLDIDNPNSPTEEAVESYDGLVLLGIGLQSRLSQSVAQVVTINGAVSGETSPVIAYLDYQSLRKYTDDASRQPLEKDNSYVRLLWREQYRIVKTANDIIESANSISISDESKKAFIALANVGKVMAFYNLMNNWEKLPINTNEDHPNFVDRATAINECIALLGAAEANVAGGSIPTDFQAKVLGDGFDLENVIKAYQARINLMAGNYADAASAASEVTAEANYVFSQTGENPLYTHFIKSFFTKAMAYWADDAEAGDLRVAATVDITDGESRYGEDSVYTIIKYSTATDPVLIYTMNEMALIKAEAYARSGSGNAENEVNQVRADAGLAAFDGSTSILEEIFKQRFYECYLTGQHWEDFRRFENDNISYINNLRFAEMAHEWLVYPDWEIDKNPNTPAQQTQINL